MGTSVDHPARSTAHGVDSLVVLKRRKQQFGKADNSAARSLRLLVRASASTTAHQSGWKAEPGRY